MLVEKKDKTDKTVDKARDKIGGKIVAGYGSIKKKLFTNRFFFYYRYADLFYVFFL